MYHAAHSGTKWLRVSLPTPPPDLHYLSSYYDTVSLQNGCIHTVLQIAYWVTKYFVLHTLHYLLTCRRYIVNNKDIDLSSSFNK